MKPKQLQHSTVLRKAEGEKHPKQNKEENWVGRKQKGWVENSGDKNEMQDKP